jgi:integrator complex subunit 11
MDIGIMPLGAGQEVGRSCIMLNAGATNVMLDCGVHLGKRGMARLPAFDAIGGASGIRRDVHAIVVTHFHLDHIGALPYVTEALGYRGPVVMTAATRALAPLILEDYRQICASRCVAASAAVL